MLSLYQKMKLGHSNRVLIIRLSRRFNPVLLGQRFILQTGSVRSTWNVSSHGFGLCSLTTVVPIKLNFNITVIKGNFGPKL